MDWKIIGTSVTGVSHIANGNSCQDACNWLHHDGVLVAVVCDGAGTAAESGYGAEHGAKTICEELIVQFSSNQHHPERDELEMWIKIAIRTARKTLPGVIDDKDMRRYHATVVGAIMTEQTGVFFHIGDGAAVAACEGQRTEYITSQPENGRNTQQTYFYTEPHWYKHLRITTIPFTTDMFTLMSDGTASFAMNRLQTGWNQRFIDPVDRYLQQVDEYEGKHKLSAVLQSPDVSAKTSDDKTLLWARRR